MCVPDTSLGFLGQSFVLNLDIGFLSDNCGVRIYEAQYVFAASAWNSEFIFRIHAKLGVRVLSYGSVSDYRPDEFDRRFTPSQSETEPFQ